MQKKLIAVAVAGALTAPGLALAQTSTVQIGGSLTVFYYSHDAGNGLATPANAVTGQGPLPGSRRADILETSEPEIFIRGEEQLGGGLSAWFQCTSSFDGFITGAATAFGWCARNSGIGFKGAWGNAFFANWDTPHKLVFNRIRGAFGGTNPMTGGSAVILAGGSASGQGNAVQTTSVLVSAAAPGGGAGVSTTATMSNTPQSFFRRQSSTITYHSPSWSGFQFQGAYSAANESTGIPENGVIKPRMWSVAAHYDNGPLYLGIGYERHQDYNPSNTALYSGGDDNSWILGAGYTFAGKFKLTGLYIKTKYETSNFTTGPSDLKIDGFAIFADWNVAGPHTVRAAYGRVDDTKGSAAQNVGSYKGPLGLGCGPSSITSCAGDTGAQWWNVHYEYAFSKRTAVLINYNRISNDGNAAFSLGKTAATAGGDQSAFGMGIKHRF